MTPITSGNSTSGVGTAPAAPAAQSGPDSMEFLTLLTAQLSQQDPLEPMDNEEMMNQIVSIQTMEGLENLRVSIESLSRQRNVRAADLLGTTVELQHESATVVGTVDSIRFQGNDSLVVINGKSYPESAIVTVRQS